MKKQMPSIITLFALLTFGPVHLMAQSQSELIGEGAIVAFHKQMRNPVTPKGREMQEFATRTDLSIVRIDHCTGNEVRGKYFLVQYWLYQRAVSDREINKPKLRFQLREPREVDGKQPCMGMTRLESDPFKFRPMRIEDFQRTESGQSDTIPSLKELSCLIVEKPPTVLAANSSSKAATRPTPTTH